MVLGNRLSSEEWCEITCSSCHSINSCNRLGGYIIVFFSSLHLTLLHSWFSHYLYLFPFWNTFLCLLAPEFLKMHAYRKIKLRIFKLSHFWIYTQEAIVCTFYQDSEQSITHRAQSWWAAEFRNPRIWPSNPNCRVSGKVVRNLLENGLINHFSSFFPKTR